MSKYGKLVLEGLGVVLAAGVIIFFVGTAHSSSSGVSAQPNDPNPAQSANADSTDGAYACPMHPDQTANDPDGKCPICEMKVVPKDQIQGNGQTGACPMHPGNQSQDPYDNSMHRGMHHQPVGNQGGDGSN